MMYKKTDHINDGPNTLNELADFRALTKLLNNFQILMRKRIVDRLDDGRSGWDSPDWKPEAIRQRIIDSLNKGDMVDVANFAMFLWNRNVGVWTDTQVVIQEKKPIPSVVVSPSREAAWKDLDGSIIAYPVRLELDFSDQLDKVTSVSSTPKTLNSSRMGHGTVTLIPGTKTRLRIDTGLLGKVFTVPYNNKEIAIVVSRVHHQSFDFNTSGAPIATGYQSSRDRDDKAKAIGSEMMKVFQNLQQIENDLPYRNPFHGPTDPAP